LLAQDQPCPPCITLREAEWELPVWPGQVAAMVESSQGPVVGLSLEVGALQEALLVVALDRGRTAPPVVSHAVAAQAMEPCRTLVLARANTSRRRLTNMSGVGEISM